MEKTLAIILAGGRGGRLGILAHERTKPAIPFAGKYRIIDFTLSNCVNSGISKIAVMTQYQPLSLIEHIGIGAAWGLANMDGTGMRLLQPYLAREEGRNWYKGTADAVYQNIQYIEEQNPELVLILSGDHIYRIDYEDMARYHRKSQADVTLATTTVPYEEASRFGTVTVDQDGRISSFQEKVKKPESNLASMGVYLFTKEALIRCLEEDAQLRSSKHDFGRNVFPRIVSGSGKAYAYDFHGYWRDVGTVASYWEANMDLLELRSSLVFDPAWPIRTKEAPGPPAIVSQKGRIKNSMISCGCVIEGSVEHSVLSPGVTVAEGTLVKNSIVLSDSVIGPGSVVDYSILDKEVVVGPGCHIGFGDNFQISRKEPKVANTGITIIGKRARVPSGIKIGRNCIIYHGVAESDFSGSDIQSGETIKPKRRNSPGNSLVHFDSNKKK
ncbi:MAG: glucose-1-phosphate adenylyltransferase [Dehalococcoidales bacterium]|nr:glucose-1-phosphate adenylyltransferase [Dehalococcoidales bacterium]